MVGKLGDASFALIMALPLRVSGHKIGDIQAG